MPQWQTTKLDGEGEGNRRTRRTGGGEMGGWVKKETNDMRGAGKGRVPCETRWKISGRAMEKIQGSREEVRKAERKITDLALSYG